jgi:hypothetical protein
MILIHVPAKRPWRVLTTPFVLCVSLMAEIISHGSVSAVHRVFLKLSRPGRRR